MIENDKQLEVTIKTLNHFKEYQGTFGDDILGKIMEEATKSQIEDLESEINEYKSKAKKERNFHKVLREIPLEKKIEINKKLDELENKNERTIRTN